MRHGTANRRQRNRGNGGRRGGQSRTQVFDSNGPDVRIRGTAHQVAEKYLILAKDASSAGDRILAESYLQHAEHYQRVINSFSDGVHDRRPESFDAEGEDANPYATQRPQGARSDDLSLPSSILGSAPKAESQARAPERTPEVSTT